MAQSNNNNINDKLEKILNILSKTKKSYKEDIENINSKLDKNINEINKKIYNLEKNLQI